jgi:RNA polymerase-binding protein DksA
MTKKDMDRYKKILLKLKEQHMTEMNDLGNSTREASSRESSGEISAYTTHMADMASDAYDTDFTLSRVSMDQNRLYVINDAIKRIEEGRYGICEACENKISKKRLLAVPFASMCVKCQSKQEKKRRI